MRIVLAVTLTLLVAVSLASTKKKPPLPLVTKVVGVPQGDALNNVNSELTSLKSGLKAPLRKSSVLVFYHDSVQRVVTAMQPFGYMQAKVHATRNSVKGKWVIQYSITPGPVVKVTKLTVDITGPGKSDKHFRYLLKNFPIKVGEDLNIPKYTKAKNLFYNISSQYGYFKSQLSVRKIIINIKQHTAQVVFKFETGPRSRFGTTTFSKNPFARSFLNRYLRYKTGEYYDSEKVQATQNGLSKSNYFQSLSVDPEVLKQQNSVVPIKIHLIMRKRRAYLFGLGYGTDSGIRATLGFDLRWVNKYGHYFQTRLRGSEINNELVTTYYIPGSHPSTSQYMFQFTGGKTHLASGKSKILKLTVGDNRELNQYWRQSITVNALREDYDLNRFPPTVANLIYPEIRWNYLNQDRRESPNRGMSLALSLSGTPHALSTTSGFAQERVGARFLDTIMATQTRFIFRTEWGKTQIRDVSNLPFSLQLFAGGARSIRGYDYEQIGPGRDLVVGSAEIQQKVYGPLYLAGFYDVGNVADGAQLFKHMNEGVGPGLAVLTPLGMIELTAAKAISRPGEPWIIQFSVGPVL
ncbi:MAG: BamA/TamA family outer membrane protein [Gammaproteobacteria bacterium]|nr:BamA/TamA family outer membrane protein [Gammaproteobacteria bacterium]